MALNRIGEPWQSFLADVDRDATSDMDLVCIGGFAVTIAYDAPRATADLDVLSTVRDPASTVLLERAGKGGEWHRRHGVYIDQVSVATPPCGYAVRLREIPGTWTHLRLFVPDACDLALLKLERNLERDREDVKWLARTAPLDLNELQRRYEEELRPYLIGPLDRYDLTLKLWMDMILEGRAANP